MFCRRRVEAGATGIDLSYVKANSPSFAAFRDLEREMQKHFLKLHILFPTLRSSTKYNFLILLLRRLKFKSCTSIYIFYESFLTIHLLFRIYIMLLLLNTLYWCDVLKLYVIREKEFLQRSHLLLKKCNA